MRRKPKPAGAWSLVFLGGSLEGDTDRWNLDCPADWANKREEGGVDRYVLKDRDEARKVATMELVTDDSERADRSPIEDAAGSSS